MKLATTLATVQHTATVRKTSMYQMEHVLFAIPITLSMALEMS
jgi:hypothetical protein